MSEDLATIATSTSLVPGWFGKIPALGDFAVRRLPPEFTDTWDAWLAESLGASQEALGEGWRDAYLRAPIWRFALTPGIVDERFWFGVLLPSVDRVGRHFPLTIAVPSEALPRPSLDPLEAWYERVSASALGCLSAETSVEAFEEKLAGLAPLAFGGGASLVHADDTQLRIDAARGIDAAGADLAREALLRDLALMSFWWARFDTSVAPTIVAMRGLPAPSSFVRLLDGSL